jgi:hypothetical protein
MIYFRSIILTTLALKVKCYFSNYEYDNVDGNGTMVCVDGGGSIERVLFI